MDDRIVSVLFIFLVVSSLFTTPASPGDENSDLLQQSFHSGIVDSVLDAVDEIISLLPSIVRDWIADRIDTLVSSIESSISSLETYIDVLLSEISNLENRIDDLRDRYYDTLRDVFAVEDFLGERIDEIVIKYDNVREFAEDVLSAELSDLRFTIASLEDYVDDLLDEIAQQSTTISNLRDRVSGLLDDIASLERQIDDLFNRIQDLQATISDLRSQVDDLTSTISDITNVLSDLAGATASGDIDQFLDTVDDSLSLLPDPVELPLRVIFDFIDAQVQDLRDQIGTLVDRVDALDETLGNIVLTLRDIADATASGDIDQFLDAVDSAVETLPWFVENPLRTIFEFIGDQIQNLRERIQDLVNVRDNIVSAFVEIADATTSGDIDRLLDVADSAIESLPGFVETPLRTIFEFIDGVISDLRDRIQQLEDRVNDLLAFRSDITDALPGASDVQNAAQELVQAAEQAGISVPNAILDAAENGVGGVLDIIRTMASIITFLPEILSEIGGTVDDISQISEELQNQVIEQILQDLRETIFSPIDTVTESIDQVAEDVRDLLSVNLFQDFRDAIGSIADRAIDFLERAFGTELR